jgi:predicted flap endonuclease-1-like 5' DNA nuclease
MRLNPRRVLWAGLLIVLLLALSTSAVAAQGGSGDKVVMGGNYTLAQGQTLNSRLIVLGGNATLETESTVNGDVTVMGGTLRIAGTVRGAVAVFGGTVHLDNTAVVNGSLNTWGGSIQRASGAVVSGATQDGPARSQGLNPLNPPLRIQPLQTPARSGPLSFILGLILKFFGSLGLGLLLALIGVVALLIAPKPTGQVASTVASQPAINFAVGLLTLVLATLIGFPLLILCGLGLLVWLLALLALLFGWVAVGLWLGQRILAAFKVQNTTSLSEVAIGVFLITWLTWLAPACIGWLIGVVLGSIGMGAVLLTRFGTQPPTGSRRPVPPSGPTYGGGQLPARSTLVADDMTMERPVTPAPSTEGVFVPPTESAPAETPVVGEPEVSDVTGWESAAARTPAATETPGAPDAVDGSTAPVHTAGSLEDLTAVQGISPETADRLRAAGTTTLVALATADPDELAAAAGISADQVRREDWIGQARHLLG